MTTCARCGRPLAHPDSVARGVGPVCGGRPVRCAPRAPALPVVADHPDQLVLWAYQLALPLLTVGTPGTHAVPGVRPRPPL